MATEAATENAGKKAMESAMVAAEKQAYDRAMANAKAEALEARELIIQDNYVSDQLFES